MIISDHVCVTEYHPEDGLTKDGEVVPPTVNEQFFNNASRKGEFPN